MHQMVVPARNRTAKLFLYTSIFWLLVAMILGLVVSIKSVHPDFLTGNTWLQRYFTYGKLRPAHTNTALYGWLSTGFFGIMFYAIPSLCRTHLHSDKLGVFSCYFWNFTYLAGAISLLAGFQTGIEYAEMPLPIDILLVISIAMISYNLLRTAANRKERILYVSMWYFLGSLIWLPMTYIVGNFPPYIGSGMSQQSYYFFFLHNIVGLWFTPVGVGTIYYILPKLTKTPIYSHKLSLMGFWTIATFYVWNGPHHLVNGPIPLWLMKAGIIPSVLLIIPVWSVLANFIGTLKGVWWKVSQDTILKMLVTGGLFYILTSMQGCFQSLMAANAILHFTYWTVGHAHMALFAGFSLVLASGIYYVLPYLIGRQIYSKTFMEWHYWLSVIGFIIFAFAMWTAGVFQGFQWIDGNQNGSAFAKLFETLHIYLVLRAIGGSLMFFGQIIFAWNIYKTATNGELMAQPENRLKAANS